MTRLLREKLIYELDLTLPGFEKNVPQGSIYQYAFEQISATQWFNKFVARVNASIGKEYLPIYRMADGEFIFCLGYEIGFSLHNRSKPSALWTKIKNSVIKPTYKTCWGEEYNPTERESIIEYYINCVKEVSDKGLLAIHFVRSATGFSEQYFEAMCNWLDSHRILLTPQNYTSFYFVYALLNGPERFRLFSNKRVLVVTSLDEEKKRQLSEGLENLDVSNVQFLNISKNKSLFDRIDLSMISLPVDIILVGAGIGAANILYQLHPLKTVCIDAGICIEAIADTRKKNRAFLKPDREIE